MRQPSLWKIENSKAIPNGATLLKLAKALETSIDHLVAGVDADYNPWGLTYPVSEESTNVGTSKKGGASDVPASAQARIRELEQELDALKTAIATSALNLSDLVGSERLRTARKPSARRGRKGRKAG